jgi:hypothetical protein
LAGGVHRRRPAARPAPSLYPLLDRIENIETRVKRVELTPSPIVPPAPEEIEALGTLVSSQAEDIAGLRHDILEIERRNAGHVEVFGHKIALLERQLPIQIEAGVAAKMTELEHRLRGEFQDIHYRTVDAFADTIEKRVVNRINLLENSLIEQSHSIAALREKSLRTDDNLQRLLQAVEKLCERAESKSQIPIVEPQVPPESQAVLTPSAHFESAVQTNEAVATFATEEPANESEFTPVYESAGDGSSHNGHFASPRRSMSLKPVGVALLGLAVIGFRLIK